MDRQRGLEPGMFEIKIVRMRLRAVQQTRKQQRVQEGDTVSYVPARHPCIQTQCSSNGFTFADRTGSNATLPGHASQYLGLNHGDCRSLSIADFERRRILRLHFAAVTDPGVTILAWPSHFLDPGDVGVEIARIGGGGGPQCMGTDLES